MVSRGERLKEQGRKYEEEKVMRQKQTRLRMGM